MTIAYIGLGSNLDSPVRHVSIALSELGQIPESRLTGQSSLYRCAPMVDLHQPDYINAVAELDTTLSAGELLRNLQEIEHIHGRVRSIHWGPRTLDLDLLLYGDEHIIDNQLTVPHPGVGLRNFVLCPLVEIAPDIVIPGLRSAKHILADIGLAGLERLNSE